DTIAFDTSGAFAGNATINLNSEIAIADATVIQGTGASKLTIQQTGADQRVFNVNDGITGRHSPVTIAGVTMTGGNRTGTTPTDRGGAILIDDDTLTISDCVVNANSAQTSGGALAVNGSAGALTILRCTISNNNVLDPAPTPTGDGGGIWAGNNALLSIMDSTISGNTAPDDGGGIYLFNSALLLLNSTISGNSTTFNSTAYGGAIFTAGAPPVDGVVIRNCTI